MGNENMVRLEVRSRSDRGFRRVGRLFGQDPIEDSFTEDAARILETEPQLIVRRLGAAPAAAPPPEPPAPPPPPNPEVRSAIASAAAAPPDASPFVEPAPKKR